MLWHNSNQPEYAKAADLQLSIGQPTYDLADRHA
jgi:hypothetical protein